MVRQEKREGRPVIQGGESLARWYIGTVLATVAVLCLVMLPVNVWAGPEPEKSAWHVQFNLAEKLAKENKTPLLIHFHASWCGPCRAMEADVLSTREVLSALKTGIVAVKVDSDQHPELIARFGVSALPADVIVGVDGRILSKTIGSSGRHAYLATLARFSVAPARSTGKVLVQVDSAPPRTAPAAKVGPAPSVTVPPAGIPASAVVALNQTPKTENTPITDNTKELTAATPGKSIELVAGTSDATITAPKTPATLTKSLRRDADARIGLNGFSPVVLAEAEKWKAGEAQYKHEFEGVCYHLSSIEELEKFKANPSKFVPALHGCDPVALLNDQLIQSGHIELGVSYKSKVYFFTSPASRDVFLSDPGKFANSYNLTFASNSEDKG